MVVTQQLPVSYLIQSILTMNIHTILENFSHAPVLFFFLGVMAVLVKSDLDIPPAISKFLGIYLLFDIGIKGGEELF